MAKDIGHEGPYDFNKGYGSGLPTKGDEMNLTPIFSYQNIDLGKTLYHFHLDDPDFSAHDRKIYFSKLRKYSRMKLKELMNLPHDDHFKIDVDPNTAIIALVEQVYDKKVNTTDKPIIGHFALYTTPIKLDAQNRPIRSKSPRVFFHLDTSCVFHILFYDPYHEINQMGQQTIDSLTSKQ